MIYSWEPLLYSANNSFNLANYSYRRSGILRSWMIVDRNDSYVILEHCDLQQRAIGTPRSRKTTFSLSVIKISLHPLGSKRQTPTDRSRSGAVDSRTKIYSLLRVASALELSHVIKFVGSHLRRHERRVLWLLH